MLVGSATSCGEVGEGGERLDLARHQRTTVVERKGSNEKSKASTAGIEEAHWRRNGWEEGVEAVEETRQGVWVVKGSRGGELEVEGIE
jgi:hypothetical protein